MTDSVPAAEATTAGQPATEAERRLRRASHIVSSSTAWAAGAGLVPLPFLDLVAIGAVQVKMISDLGTLYGQSLTKEAVRSVVSVLLGVLLPGELAGGVAASGAKLVPALGSVFGAVSLSALGAAATYAMGKVFVRHFEAGGTLESFRPERVEAELKEEFKAAQTKPKPQPA